MSLIERQEKSRLNPWRQENERLRAENKQLRAKLKAAVDVLDWVEGYAPDLMADKVPMTLVNTYRAAQEESE